MATRSAVSTQMDTAAAANPSPWSTFEAGIEVIKSAVSGVTLGASDAAADPGSNATKAIAVQFVTNGKHLLVTLDAETTKVLGTVNIAASQSVGIAAGSALIGKVGIDQTTPGSTNGVQPKQYSGVPSSFAIQTADQTVFTLAAGEVGFIQVLSADAPLAVKLGATASTSSLNFILPASVADSDGSGGVARIDYWVGVVSVAKMTGTSKYLAWKQAA